MDTLKTLHIVGFKNSGKTTLIARWVRLLKGKGYSIAVLKHHGHGGQPTMPNSTTDTMQFFDSGAAVSVVAGGGTVQLLLHDEPDFTGLKELAAIAKPDILFIEGYKKEQGKKVVLLRDTEDWGSLSDLEGIQLIIGCPEIATSVSHIESRVDVGQLDSWLFDWVEKEDGDETV
ncbi:molybdopterin-guanine dinucleotide biosynthesis protein B [Sporosarcina sp. ANT_H38]|uniref:molybdopterin-guanine dinucleotide biosynthesis protein B n=1 Tax=Sporosarcina sp. ANT_H38 TaxID=2597358 RepID=UPI0011F0C4EA|nr:molybdopterin-guanine dinucleotide biosynthesis protein B [Sporosarcina sp. ANT_H38]KAA0955780.1 molybdopterin-guanine dinucleotide biosynthesis protein B [Sporosarcina sp. ANT_H38]